MLSRYVVPDMPTTADLLPYLRQMDDQRWYSNFGPLVTKFEERLTHHLNAVDESGLSPAISLTSVTSCFHALQIGLQLFNLPADARVLVPAVTFPACPLAVKHAGATSVLADIDTDSWQLTPQIARHIAAQTKIHAVMPVAVYGVGVDAAAWDAFTCETGIPVVIDAAAAFETQIIPEHCLVAYSLHATKPFCIGEGGILASRRREWNEKARCLSNFGTENRITKMGGVNAKLSEYAGAVGLAQLDRWSAIKRQRVQLFTDYVMAIKAANLPFAFQAGIESAIVSTLMIRSSYDGAAIAAQLDAHGIFAHRMYLPPLYQHPYFADLDLRDTEGRSVKKDAQKNLNAAMMQQHLFGLPFHNFITTDDIEFIVQKLSDAMQKGG